MKRSLQIFVAVGAWLVGLVVAALWALHLSVPGLSVLGSIALTSLYLVRSRLGYILILVAFLSFGLLRGQLYFLDQSYWSVTSLVGDKVELTGRVASEPTWNKDRLYEFYLSDIKQGDRPVPGLMKIKSLVGNVSEGEVVQVVGKVGHALGRAPTQIWYAKVTVLDSVPPFPIRFKNLLSRGLASSLPHDQAGFVRGLLFGSSSAVAPDLEENLRTDGLTHVIAVSGYNLTIIVAAITVFTRRRSRNALLLALGGIGFFVLMTGAPASVMRAAVMAGLFLMVSYYRRQLDPRVALATTILIMTAWSPDYLYSDIGWQLSVMALAGVLVLAPGFMLGAHHGEPRRHHVIWEIFAAALGAYLATAPLLAYYFGSLSLVGPLANVFVLPVIPLIMLLGFVAALTGVLLPNLAFTLMQPVAWVVRLVTEIIALSAHLPHASQTVELGVVMAALCYVALAILAIAVGRRASKNIAKKVYPNPSEPSSSRT